MTGAIYLRSPDASITRLHIAPHFRKIGVGPSDKHVWDAQTFCGASVLFWQEVARPKDEQGVCAVCLRRFYDGKES